MNHHQIFNSFESSSQLTQKTPQKLISLGQLFSKSWQIYKARASSFVGLMAILAIFILLGSFIGIGGTFLAIFSMNLGFVFILFFLIILISILLVILQSWIIASLFYLIKEKDQKIGIKESLRKGRKVVFSFIWIGLLTGIIVFGGTILLIIPGIIFAVWFAFSQYVLINEGLKGRKALWKSKKLVQGKWWGVAWRLFIIFGVGIILETLRVIFAPIPLIGIIIALFRFFFLIPFGIIYVFLLYEDLKTLKGL